MEGKEEGEEEGGKGKRGGSMRGLKKAEIGV